MEQPIGALLGTRREPEQRCRGHDQQGQVQCPGPAILDQPHERPERRRGDQLVSVAGPERSVARREARHRELQAADHQEHAQPADQAGHDRERQVVHEVAQPRPRQDQQHGAQGQGDQGDGGHQGGQLLGRCDGADEAEPDRADHQGRFGRDHAHAARIAPDQGDDSRDQGGAQEAQAERGAEALGEWARECEADIGECVDRVQDAADQSHKHGRAKAGESEAAGRQELRPVGPGTGSIVPAPDPAAANRTGIYPRPEPGARRYHPRRVQVSTVF